MMKEQNILIGLCTSKRPKMLSNCLASLKEQKIPENAFLTLVVVENSQTPEVKEVIERFMPEFRYQLIYVHEPERGIPIARNKVIEKALEIKADWIAFIDDDETADKEWIKNLLLEAEKYQADAVQGEVIQVYPEPAPLWALKKRKSKVKTGDILLTASTNNVLFSKIIFETYGLRFDETMRFTGGSDAEYFWRAYTEANAKMVFSSLPVVREEIPPSRCTYKYQFERTVRLMACDMVIKRKQTDYITAARHYFRKFFKNVWKLIIRLIVLPFSIFFGINAFKIITFKGIMNIGVILGYIMALVNFKPQPYKQTDGK